MIRSTGENFLAHVVQVLVAQGVSGTASLLIVWAISNELNVSVAAEALSYLATVNFVILLLALPVEAVISTTVSPASTIRYYFRWLPILSFAMIALFLSATDGLQSLPLSLIFLHSASLSLGQTTSSVFTGTGDFKRFFVFSLVNSLSSICSVGVVLLLKPRDYSHILYGGVIGNLLGVAISRYRGTRQQYRPILKATTSDQFSRRLLLQKHLSLMCVFGIGALLQNGVVMFSRTLGLGAGLTIQYAVTLSFIRVFITILSTVMSPFRALLKSQFLIGRHRYAFQLTLRFQLVFIGLSLPLAFFVAVAIRSAFALWGSGHTDLGVSTTFLIVLSELLIVFAIFAHIFNTFYVQPLTLILPWASALLVYVYFILPNSSNMSILYRPQLASGLLLLIATTSIARSVASRQ